MRLYEYFVWGRREIVKNLINIVKEAEADSDGLDGDYIRFGIRRHPFYTSNY